MKVRIKLLTGPRHVLVDAEVPVYTDERITKADSNITRYYKGLDSGMRAAHALLKAEQAINATGTVRAHFEIIEE